MSLSNQVERLEAKCEGLADLTGMILATLALNSKHMFRNDVPANEVFQELLEKWYKRFKELEQ